MAITPAPLIAAAARRIQHRTYTDADGVRMLRQDGRQAVWLTAEQHRALLDDSGRAMRPVNKRAKWGFALSIPVTIWTLGKVHVLGWERIIDASGVPGASFVSVLLILTWWPLLVLLNHRREVRRVNAMVDERLATMPVAPAPPPRPVAFQTLEVIALFLIGPGLLIDVIGSLFPHAFDHTPFMGRGLGPISIAGLVVFGLLAGRRLLHRRGVATPAERHPAAAAPPNRVTGIVGRARADGGA